MITIIKVEKCFLRRVFSKNLERNKNKNRKKGETMKKKFFTLLLCGAIMVLTCGSTACGGGDKAEAVDPTKIQLNVGVFDGGFGSEWLYNVKARFERDFADFTVGDKKGVQVMPEATRSVVGMSSLVNLPYDVVFTEQMPYYNFVGTNEMLDITDVVRSSLADYGESGTIEDKMYDAQKNYFKVDGKYYGMPHYAGSYGVFYDVDMFQKYSLYFAGEESVANRTAKFVGSGSDKEYVFTDGESEVLSSGPDGIVGNADDGLPATTDQFICLCGNMLEQGITPITYSGTTSAYLTQWLRALAVNLVPEDEADLLWTNSGTSTCLIESIADDGSVTLMNETTVTPETGYLSHRQAGRYYALSLYEKLYRNGYLYSKTAGTYSHLEAQHSFILGTYGKVARSVDKIGLLFDGTWFENESSNFFTDMANNGYGDGALKQNRHLAIMPMPKASEDDLGRNVMLDALITAAFIPSSITPEKVSIAKEFLKYCYTDASLREFTVTTGTLIGMDYDLTNEDKTELSHYTKSLVELKENSKLVYPISENEIYKRHQASFIQTNYGWETQVNNLRFSEPAAFYGSTQLGSNQTAVDYFRNLYEFYSETYWAGFVN